MTRYFALALNTGSLAAKTKPAASSRPKFSWRPKNLRSAILSALFVLGVAYLIQVNSISTKGYEIKQLEQKLVEVREQNERLELEARSLKAIETIQAQAQALNLVPSQGVNYFSGNGYAFER
ncbi:MAG: hypothetical protein A3J05_03725 [Candidatus Doudnabacteria bacterium RIFCSPLOWO2_02_FULL_48_13]|uniref:Cell division protein FtsL n=1 Tax=Candidatus Doudnabacteria bacterium RIFCSPLOWO2_02_FULL_48_13 TaxID=1817845 RepID=A0A1F5QB47_9BACT|nr:MAG: hypothetical protein A3F44_01730 [Candidatus Doudnabacteria bacterium RIFCSPHIGHO2_12_FULL_47_25]OGE99423.1 MAG: hypothetical protein A3J05_03725 [Candidatus Doudnabacteria bacterium RIFCSPLOWO2_02_FULL_48_13]OGF00449.1 MAG: hypothetical protein A3G07_03975 [Candidatus Doudnabacteria bacterium RIFCSPLOWO2_12_FULL_47_12]